LSYPKSLIITFNLCGNLSLNTRGIKLPSHESNPKSILHRRSFSDRHTYLIQPFLATGRYCQENSTAPMFLVPTSECNPIRNGRKSFPCSFKCHFGSMLKPNSFRVQKLILVSQLLMKVTSGFYLQWS
jgi:hypothetical protein